MASPFMTRVQYMHSKNSQKGQIIQKEYLNNKHIYFIYLYLKLRYSYVIFDIQSGMVRLLVHKAPSGCFLLLKMLYHHESSMHIHTFNSSLNFIPTTSYTYVESVLGLKQFLVNFFFTFALDPILQIVGQLFVFVSNLYRLSCSSDTS